MRAGFGRLFVNGLLFKIPPKLGFACAPVLGAGSFISSFLFLLDAEPDILLPEPILFAADIPPVREVGFLLFTITCLLRPAG